MSQYIIEGGHKLKGDVHIGGAKNAALAILPATLMTNEKVIIDNVPNVSDVRVMLRAFEKIGVKVRYIDEHKIEIQAENITTTTLDYDIISGIRASYYLLGALLGRYKEAAVVMPGGCDIGSRPIDLHLKGFKDLGAENELRNGLIWVKADNKELVGNSIYIDKVSVGATINIMMAATLAKGVTVLENCAKEPHVVDVANFLNSMGANIKGAGTDKIRIYGVEKLHGCEYSIIPDQIEAGTFMMAAVATCGEVTVKDVIPKHLEAISAKILEMGSEVIEYEDSVKVIGKRPIKSGQVVTLPYPAYPTDMQPQTSTVYTLGNGITTVVESIFENRFKYVDELARMGAEIRIMGNAAHIEGVKKLSGARVKATDLRAGAALVIAALAAESYSCVDSIEYVERGYENFEKKLSDLGARILKSDDAEEIEKFKNNK